MLFLQNRDNSKPNSQSQEVFYVIEEVYFI